MSIKPTPRQGLLPVSFAQQRLWFMARMFPESIVYNEPIVIQMEGPTNVVVLARCLTEITVREMAAHHVAVVRAHQPEGPYCLGGASFGGMLAYEIAQQLQAQGQEVAFVAMMDTGGGQDWTPPPERDREILAYVLTNGRLDSARAAEFCALPPDEQVRRFIETTRESGSRMVPAMRADQVRPFVDVWQKTVKAMRAYEPASSRVPLVYFHATIPHPGVPRSSDLYWREVALGGFDLHEIAGDHISINYPPSVDRIAETLAAYMAR